MNYENPLFHGYYPFPVIPASPHVQRMGEDMANWLNNDYTFLTERSREWYKLSNLNYTTGRMLPNANMSYEHIKPANRWMLLITIFDDFYELSTVEEIKHVADRLITILRGGDPFPGESVFFRQAAIMRDELRAFMSDEWLERFIEHMHYYVLYGMCEEARYITTGSLPKLAVYALMRAHDVAMIPFSDFVDCEIGFTLPKYVADHPIILRLRLLTSRIIAWQNDFHSLQKEMNRPRKVCQLINVIEAEQKLSFKEAAEVGLRYHDADVAEFISLQSSLPDFGSIHKEVENYVSHLGINIQGLNSWYTLDTFRYKGFHEVETV